MARRAGSVSVRRAPRSRRPRRGAGSRDVRSARLSACRSNPRCTSRRRGHPASWRRMVRCRERRRPPCRPAGNAPPGPAAIPHALHPSARCARRRRRTLAARVRPAVRGPAEDRRRPLSGSPAPRRWHAGHAAGRSRSARRGRGPGRAVGGPAHRSDDRAWRSPSRRRSMPTRCAPDAARRRRGTGHARSWRGAAGRGCTPGRHRRTRRARRDPADSWMACLDAVDQGEHFVDGDDGGVQRRIGIPRLRCIDVDPVHGRMGSRPGGVQARHLR